MANPNPKTAHLKKFKPGTSGNPAGSRLHNPAFKAMRKMSQGELADVMLYVANSNMDELIEASKNGKLPSLQAAVVRCFAMMIKKGDSAAFDRLMNRMVGQVKQVVEVKNPEGEAFRTQQMSAEEIAKELAEIEAREKARHGSK